MNHKTATIDPVDEYIAWNSQEHETYIPPAIMRGYVAPADADVSTLAQRAKWKVTSGTKAVVSLTMGILTGFSLFALVVLSQGSPAIAALSIIGVATMAILGPMVAKKFELGE